MNTSAAALYYNETLLAEAGITIPEADPNNRLTWEEPVSYTHLDVYKRQARRFLRQRAAR